MERWTKKVAIERMRANHELQAVYQECPLARKLVESAVKMKRYDGYNNVSCHSAYKEWLFAAIPRGESAEYYVCLKVIDDLLPPNCTGRSIYSNNPALPDLPPLPEHEVKQGESPYKAIHIAELFDDNSEFNQRLDRRLRLMIDLLEKPKKETHDQ